MRYSVDDAKRSPANKNMAAFNILIEYECFV